MDLSDQYNAFADKFSEVHDKGEGSNRDNRKTFYEHIDFITPGVKVLDLACGDGLDLAYYKSLGAEIFGLDASGRLIEIAKQKNPGADIRVGLFEKIPFDTASFDVILSKYAIQTSEDMRPVFSEINRVLKPGGIMMYLVTHPFRQYFEKKEPAADYFKQSIVEADILNHSIIVKEPTHTFNEYLDEFLFQNFDVQFFGEYWDQAAEQIDGRKYPGYFILKARKR